MSDPVGAPESVELVIPEPTARKALEMRESVSRLGRAMDRVVRALDAMDKDAEDAEDAEENEEEDPDGGEAVERTHVA